MSREDTLKDFIKLLYNQHSRNKNEYSEIHDLLIGLTSHKEAFLMLYNNLSEEEKPNWETYNNQYYVERFVNFLKQLDDDEFNKHFFSGLHKNKFIDIPTIRIESAKRPNNSKLNFYIEQIDKPKNIDQLLDKLIDLHQNNKDKYNAFLEENYNRFSKINSITAQKSRTVDLLMGWFSHVADKQNFNEVLNLSKEIGLDLFKISSNTNKMVRIRKLDLDDLLGLKRLIEENPNETPYKVIKMVTSLKNITEVFRFNFNPNEIDFLWEAFKEEILNHPNRIYQHNITTIKEEYRKKYNEDLNDPVFIFQEILKIRAAREKIHIYFEPYKQEMDRMLKTLKVIELNKNLTKKNDFKKARKI